jgi:K+-sensing histidine kinase KdpD
MELSPLAAPSKSLLSRLAAQGLLGAESSAGQWLRATLTVLACTLVCWVIEPYLQRINLILVYMSGVVYVALRSTRKGAWIAIVLSIAIFDFIYVPPRWAFKPTDPQYYFTFVVMTLVGLLVTELALGARHQAAAAARAGAEAETERVRSTLLHGLSHDFRTPLTTIVGAASSLLEQGDRLDAERRRSLLSGIVGEAQRMSSMTSALLDLTRMEEGAVQPRCEWCPAEEMIQEALQALEPRLGGRELRVHVSPDAVVWCDPRLVEQVLSNLLDNALKHAPGAGPIDIMVVIGAHDWSLSVADHGPGLPSGHESAVFKKFYRGPGAERREGVGLGLALCAAIARAHGGQVVARNQHGALVVMTLPQPALRTAELDP